jgi:hypothetical protein
VEFEISFGGDAWDVECRTSGVADRETWLRLRHELLLHPQFRRGMTLLTDHSALDVSRLTPDDREVIADQVSAVSEWFGPGHVAIVVPGGGMHVAREIVSHIDSDLDQHMFETREEAIAWLRAIAARRRAGSA